MIIIFARLFLRLFVLIWWVFSIFFFYVFWYTYTNKRWFIKTSWVYNIKYFSNNNSKKDIIINSNKYFVINNRLTLYWLEKGRCWIIQIWYYKKYDCYDGKRYSDIVYIPISSVKIYPITKNTLFAKLNLQVSNDYDIKYNFNWHGIRFSYYKDGTIVYKDDISTKKLIKIPWVDFVWYDNEWLVFMLDNKIYYMKFLINL